MDPTIFQTLIALGLVLNVEPVGIAPTWADASETYIDLDGAAAWTDPIDLDDFDVLVSNQVAVDLKAAEVKLDTWIEASSTEISTVPCTVSGASPGDSYSCTADLTFEGLFLHEDPASPDGVLAEFAFSAVAYDDRDRIVSPKGGTAQITLTISGSGGGGGGGGPELEMELPVYTSTLFGG